MTGQRQRNQVYCHMMKSYGEGFEDMQRRVPCIDKAQEVYRVSSQREPSHDIINDVANEFREDAKTDSQSA